MEGEGEARRPSAASDDHSSTSFALPPPSSSSPGPSSVAPWAELNQCATWEEAKHLLLSCQVPDEQLPHWWALWRWDRVKELVTSGGVDPTALDQLLMEFLQHVEGTREHYECLVPERDGRKGELCLKVVCRGDRMRSHMRSDHLGGMGGFQCEGQCGNVDCNKTFLQQRYLRQHMNPEKEECSQCGKVIYKRNMSTHTC